jgi:hypothetical protein
MILEQTMGEPGEAPARAPSQAAYTSRPALLAKTAHALRDESLDLERPPADEWAGFDTVISS